MGQKSRWTLPETVDPTGYVCYNIKVPDDPFYVAAFEGLLVELTYSKNWQRDIGHTAADVSRVWQTALASTDCDVPQVQFRQPDICILQASFDAGVTWTTIYDATVCVTDGVNQGILDALNDGTLAPGGQPGPGGSIPTQACYTYRVKLDGNGAWHSPIPVRDGYTISITDTEGACSDGPGLNYWFCPDGGRYSLGTCDSTIHNTSGTDPMPAVNHMRIVGRVATTWFDAYGGTYTVPSGTGTADLIIQPNDSPLSDNQGSYEFLVTICTGLWCFTWDFTSTNGGFVMTPGEAGVYSAGTGWIAQRFDSQNYEVSIQKTFTSTFIIDSVMTFDRASHGGANAQYRQIASLAGVTKAINSVVPGGDGTNIVHTLNVNNNVDKIRYDLNNGSPTAAGTIKRITIRGTGTPPFGASNC